MKRLSALLTLLLAALLTSPLTGTDTGTGQLPATALIELDGAKGAAGLNGKPPGAASEDAEDASDSGDPAILPAFVDNSAGGSVLTARPAGAATSIPGAPRAYLARAPPTA